MKATIRSKVNIDPYLGMMDILFAKGLGLTKKKKDSELKRLLKDIDTKKGR